jgi:sulfatase maturation enzyme AslB (radical SAM superfamily)
MELTNLTFIVTDDCNFNCSYCLQKKEKKTINNTFIETAVDFFYPFLKEHSHTSFYGGEPLLAFEKIKYTTRLIQEKNKKGNKRIEFSVTTNGSLLNQNMLDFFDRCQFNLTLSFDGLAQEKGRKKGSLAKMVQAMDRIREYPGINLEINSVFTPRTIPDLLESLRFMIERWNTEITLNISTMEEWSPSALDTLKKELDRLTDFLALFYKETGTMPVKNFKASVPGADETVKGVFYCNAGKERMAVTPGGQLWGCFLFHDYFKTREDHPQYWDYYFGPLTDFTVNYKSRYPGILANYSELRQDFFQSEKEPCFLCEDVETCAVCPINAAYTSGAPGKIACSRCELMKIQRKAREKLRQKLM